MLFDSLLAAQVLSIAGELLANAEGLLRDGLHTAEVADGYVHAAAKACAQPRHLPCIVERLTAWTP